MRNLLLASICLVLFVPIAAAGPAPPAPIDIDFRKSPGSKWIEFTSQVKNVGQQKETVFWRVKNRESQKHKMNLAEFRGGDGINDYKIRWLTESEDISDKVDDAAGYKFALAAKEKRVFEVTLQAKNGNPEPLCLTPSFYVEEADSAWNYGLYVNDSGVCG